MEDLEHDSGSLRNQREGLTKIGVRERGLGLRTGGSEGDGAVGAAQEGEQRQRAEANGRVDAHHCLPPLVHEAFHLEAAAARLVR